MLGETLQTLAARRHEAREGGRTFAVDARHHVAAEAIEQPRQRRELGRRHPRVVDDIDRIRRSRLVPFAEHDDAALGLGHRGEVDVERIEEQPARRRVGARVLGPRQRQRVQRIDADGCAAAGLDRLDQLGQRGEIADAAVVVAPQRVELMRDAPHPRAVAHPGRTVARRRRGDDRASSLAPADRHAERVIAEAGGRRHRQRQSQHRRAADPALIEDREIAAARVSGDRRARFQRQRPAQRGFGERGRQRHGNDEAGGLRIGGLRLLARDHDRRQQRAPGMSHGAAQLARFRRLAADGVALRGQQRAHGGGGRAALAAVETVVGRHDAGELG